MLYGIITLALPLPDENKATFKLNDAVLPFIVLHLYFKNDLLLKDLNISQNNI